MFGKNLLHLLIFVFMLTAARGCFNPQSSGQEEDVNPLLLVSVDGLMNEFIERNETPNFDRFLSSGVKPEYLVPVFPTKTFPNHWTIVTGLYVENHGMIANSFYDYKLDEQFSYGPPEGQNDERWWGGEPIWTTVEKQGKTAATFFWPGSEASIGGVRSSRWVDYDGSVPDSTRIDSVMSWMDPSGDVQADLGTLYFSFVDSRGHTYGPDSPEVDEAVVYLDDLLGYLLARVEAAELQDQLNIMLVSDHGMAELSDKKVIFLDEMINMNDVDVVDWSPVAMLRPAEGKTDDIYNTLKAGEENYRVYLRDELPGRFHFKDHYRIPEIIMIADVGYSITNRDYFEDGGVNGGAHGYDNLAPEMRSFMAAMGPAFKQNEMVSPVESVHLYELMAYLLQLDPAENDGDLKEVRKLLRSYDE